MITDPEAPLTRADFVHAMHAAMSDETVRHYPQIWWDVYILTSVFAAHFGVRDLPPFPPPPPGLHER